MQLPQHMQAVTRTVYGGPDVLHIQQLPLPVPKDKEVLVKVHACTVNRTDCGILRGTPFLLRFFTGLRTPKSKVPGTDFAGEVIALGKDVTRFELGDKIWGLNDEGLASQAAYLCISEDAAIETIPEGIAYENAAASAEGAHYALNFLNKVSLREGDHVLVNGASGAIGSALVQLLRNKHIRVTATGTAKQLTLLGKLGADEVIDYTQEDFTQGNVRYDAVFDAVGKSSFGRCKRVLKKRGVYISSELGPRAQNLYLPILSSFSLGKKVIFPLPTNKQKSLQIMKGMLAERTFVPLIEKHYPLEQAREAYAYAESGQKTGNLILLPNKAEG
jgi:NADPH:quinone reductase-like Zn-dependent oxidoreductase